MQTSKERILAVLKRHGRRSVDDLAAALNLAPMTVRQHLTALERDELVRMAEQRSGTGRPKHLYSLTPRGDAAFPRRYDRFAALLLAELQELGNGLTGPAAPDITGAVLDRLARREATTYRARLSTPDLRRRAHEAACVLHEVGGFAEAIDTPDGVEIRDYNCVYRGLRPDELGSCAWHVRLLPELLQAPVEELTSNGEDGQCCRLLVRCGCSG